MRADTVRPSIPCLKQNLSTQKRKNIICRFTSLLKRSMVQDSLYYPNSYTLQGDPVFKSCPMGCASELTESSIHTQHGLLLQCTNCGQLLSNASTEIYQKAMTRFDDTRRVDKNPRIHIKRMKHILKLIKNPPSTLKLLDVGCSFGMFIKVANALGFIAEGVEPSEEAALESQNNGLNVKQGFLEDLHLPSDSYDIVTLFEVIEHLESPLPLIKECHRILKPDGLFVLSTGNTDSWTCNYLKGNWDYLNINEGGHISWFNPKSLCLMADRTGFRVIDLKTRSVKLSASTEKTLPQRIIKILSQALNPVAKLLGKGHDALLLLSK